VLGRKLTPKIDFRQLTALRFLIGLPAAALIVTLQSDWGVLGALGAGDFLGTASTPSGIVVPGGLILLAAIPGLIALLSYYRGLRSTPAIVATLAELAFPLSAITLNSIFLDVVPDGSQWLGVVVLAASVVALGIVSARRMTTASGLLMTTGSLAPEPV
jgi:drug/metabolite transporter (DMT)-like permease